MSAIPPWYTEVADGTLDQGDILADCPAGFLPMDWDPNRDEQDQDIQIDTFDLVVMTQACDLAHDKVDYVVCCPVSPHSDYDNLPPFNTMNAEARNKHKDMITDGAIPGYCMIEEHTGDPDRPISLIDFHSVFGLPKVLLRRIALHRHLRLISPFREHVSQSFARFFMRVGLPANVRKFRK